MMKDIAREPALSKQKLERYGLKIEKEGEVVSKASVIEAYLHWKKSPRVPEAVICQDLNLLSRVLSPDAHYVCKGLGLSIGKSMNIRVKGGGKLANLIIFVSGSYGRIPYGGYPYGKQDRRFAVAEIDDNSF